MGKVVNYILKDNQALLKQNEELVLKLEEAKAFIEAIKRGSIDAVFVSGKENNTVLSSKTADQAYRKFIENMSEGVVTIHPNGIILYSNNSFARMVHLPLGKVTGVNLRNLIPVEFHEIYDHFDHASTAGEWKFELSLLHDGVRSYFTVSLNSIQLENFPAINLVWTDISEQKETEQKLMIANEELASAIEAALFAENKIIKLNYQLTENIHILEDVNIELGTFAHIASHDLQEPLRKIITYSNYLLKDYNAVLDERGQTYVRNMQYASERMRNLINDILEYSELSQKDAEFKPTSLQIIVEEILSALEIVIKEKKAHVIIENELPVIQANASQMRQLFQNLLSNSLKYSKPDMIPEISISYAFIDGKELENTGAILNEKYCRFYIKDNGIGFDPKYNDKIFIIFQRLHSSNVYKGTGIGLAICKKIVEKHNGFITAQGQGDEGALFTITLPVTQVVTTPA